MRKLKRKKDEGGIKLVLDSGEWVWEDLSSKHYKTAKCLCGETIDYPEARCPLCSMPLERDEMDYSREEMIRMISTSIKYGLPNGHGFRNPRGVVAQAHIANIAGMEQDKTALSKD